MANRKTTQNIRNNDSCQNSSHENHFCSTDGDEDKAKDSDDEIIEENENVVQEKIDEIEITDDEVLTAQRDLLSAYLINLLLFKKLSEDDKEFSPIKETLLRLQILIEKLYQINDKLVQEEELDSTEDGRAIPEYIMKNKGKMARKRKKEERNPRVKNKRRADEMFKKGKLVVNKNFDGKKTKTNKF